MKTCPVCQKVLTDQAKFCFYCGASQLNAEAEPVDPAVEPDAEPVEPANDGLTEPETTESPIPDQPEPVRRH